MFTLNKTILVVDDDPNMRKLIRMSIQHPSIEIVESGNGKDALALAKSQSFDLALVDGLLPGMHGFDLVRELRDLPSQAGLKIFMLTSIYKQKSYEMDARIKYGVDEYLLKPVRPDDLKKLVHDALGL